MNKPADAWLLRKDLEIQFGMSALGQKQTLERLDPMSALPPKADIRPVCQFEILALLTPARRVSHPPTPPHKGENESAARTRSLICLLYDRGKILQFVELADLDVGNFKHRIGAALDPGDGLIERIELPDPVAGDELVRLRKRPLGHRAVLARERHPRALGAWMQPAAVDHHAGGDELLVEFAHVGQQLPARQLAGFQIFGCLDQDHETHLVSPLRRELRRSPSAM